MRQTRPTTPPPAFPSERADLAVRESMFDGPREVKTGRDQTAVVSRWDRFLAASEAADGGSYREAVDKHKSGAWAGFCREMFSSLYGATDTKHVEPADRPHGADWVEKLHDAADALPEYRGLKERARRDAWATGIAAGEALKVLADQVQPPTQDPQTIQDELDFIKSLMTEGGKTSPTHMRRMAALQRQLQAAKEEVGAAVSRLAARMPTVRSAIRKGCLAANEAIDEMEGAVSALGAGEGTGIKSATKVPPKVLRDTLMKNSKLRRIAKLAGRMKAAAIQKQRTKARPGAEELCDVTAGNNLQRLLPVELGNLADEDTEALLVRRLHENSAMVYELRGKEHRSEGPIILVVDESGSMQGAPDEWSKAVMFGLMEIGARQKRPVYLVHFDGRVTRTDEFLNPAELTLKAIEDCVMHFTGGGTSIGAALAHAADVMHKNEGPWKRADVILITDGISGDYDQQKAALKRIKDRGGHFYYVGIGCTPPDHLEEEADESLVLGREDIKKGDTAKVSSAVFSI